MTATPRSPLSRAPDPSSAPPSALRPALRGPRDRKQAWVDWVFSRVAERYDLGNDIMSLGYHLHWKRRLVELAQLRPGMRVLDLAAGTGDVARMVAPRVAPGRVVASDINARMLEIGRDKASVDENIDWVGADAQALPFPDATFDVVTCGYAGRGFPDWPRTVGEVHRVLKPGGRFLNLDFARPPFRPWDVLYRGWMTVSGAALGLLLHGSAQAYVYIPESMAAYPGQRWLDRIMAKSGFRTTLIETPGCLMAYNLGTKDP